MENEIINTVSQALFEFQTLNVSPMLSAVYTGNIFEKTLVQPKLDGVRVLIKKTNDGVEFFSRTSKSLNSLNSLASEFSLFPNGVYDGEVVAKDFKSVMEQIHREKDLDISNLKIVLFDINTPKYIFLYRMYYLRTLCEAQGSNIVSCIDTFEATKTSEVEDFLELFLKQGYEGLMVRNGISTYEPKRSKNLLKYKKVQEADLRIINFYEGKNRLKDSLGGLICLSEEGLQVNVGSGFTDSEREQYWAMKEALVGRMVEINYQEKTSKSYRFPVFKKIRFDNIL